MKLKTIPTVALLAFVAISVAYLVVSETPSNQGTASRAGDELPAAAGHGEEETAAHRVIAYYLHSTQRCPTCLKIERLAEQAIRSAFADELERGEVEWRVLNMEESPNEHFVGDYALVTSSLVIADFRGGRQHAWANMERVWELVHEDEAAFAEYVAAKVREYLES